MWVYIDSVYMFGDVVGNLLQGYHGFNPRVLDIVMFVLIIAIIFEISTRFKFHPKKAKEFSMNHKIS